MDEAQINGAIETIERLISEKEAIIEKETQFLRSLKIALNRFGYDVVSLSPGKSRAPQERPAGEAQPRRKRGRPRKNAIDGNGATALPHEASPDPPHMRSSSTFTASSEPA